jgi:hypothetical protein
MAAPLGRPCEPWPYTLCAAIEDSDSYDEELLDEVVAAATEALWVLSGRRFGYCEFTIRPCASRCMVGDVRAAFNQYPYDTISGVEWWWPTCVCKAADACGCTELEEFRLPGPVSEVTEVLVDGVELAAESYRVDDFRNLVRLDGGVWPACQDMLLPATEEGTWQVTFSKGRPVPALGRLAMNALVCKLYAALTDESCESPANVVRKTRQGVTIELKGDDATAALIEWTPAIGLFLRATNPNKLQRGARVFNPDARPIGRRVDT